MAKTTRFLIPYGGQHILIYTAFAAIVVGGCWLTGRADGLFGAYVSTFHFMMLMFAAMLGMSLDGYMNVALSMGAKRSHCFWAAQLCGLVSSAILPALAWAMERLVAPLPAGEELWCRLTLRSGVLLALGGLLVTQLGLLLGRVQKPAWKTAAILLGMLFSSGLGVLLLLADGMDWYAGRFAALLSLLSVLIPVLTVVLAAAAYWSYRKAVVRV